MVVGFMIKLMVMQLESSSNKKANLEKLKYWVKKARKLDTDLIVFPEIYMFYGGPNITKEELYENAETFEDPWVKEVGKIASAEEINIIVGIYEKDPLNKKVYNTAVFINELGELIGYYRKSLLFDAFTYKESRKVDYGNGPYNIYRIQDINIGILICYELRFPEISRTYAFKGADLLIVPTAWVRGHLKEEQLLALAKVRALENTVYVGVAAQLGNEFTGISVIYDPMGIPVARALDTESYALAEISKERIYEARNKLPVLSQIKMRRDLYKELISAL
jgi:predicted amidohydrolase